MSEIKYFTRRHFLNGMGLTTAGLYFGVYAFATKPTTEPGNTVGPKPNPKQPEVEAKSIGLNPNVFIHVAPDGLVTIVCHRSEMGQGIRSSLPVLMADELGADMKRVKIVQADGDIGYGDQNTDGSNSVRGIYEEMRKVAATVRMMLTQAASARLGAKPDDFLAHDHVLTHKKTGKTLHFGDLAIEAGRLPIPDPKQVVLRPDKEMKRVGGKLPLIDGPAYVNGTAKFGADVRLPDMLIAVIARPPVLGGRVKTFDKKAALAVNGVRHVVEMPHPKPPYGFQPWGGVAVVADHTWAAMKGRDALKVTWDDGPHAEYSSETYRDKLFESVRSPGKVFRNTGDAEGALKTAAKTLTAEYYVPHLPHVAMEPPNALAKFDAADGGRCELWAPTQNPQAARTEVARALGLSEDRVTVHVTLLGGGFGRKSKADFCSEAALVSKAVGKPVRVQWTRPDDIHNDYLNTVSAQQLTAGLDEKNKVVAWRHRTAFPPIFSTFNEKLDQPGDGDLQQGVLDWALSVPNVRAEAGRAQAHVRVGWLRSVYNIFHAFAINSFIDEIAHARKMDPRENLLEMIGPPRTLSLEDLGIKELKNYGSTLERHPVDAKRLRGVVEKVTEMAKWSKRGARKGHGFGLAAHRSFNSYTAVVASVTKNAEGKVAVDEVWIAIDAGTIINPDRVRAQMEGSVINGMSYLFYGGVTHKDGKVEQNNYDGVQLVRMAKAPRKIHVEIVTSKNHPGGVGEPGLPPVAPAVANAIFALGGIRVREFNFDRTEVTV